MYEEKNISCTKDRKGDLIIVRCDIDGRKEVFNCVVGQEGRSAGGTIFGTGGQYGENKTTLVCFNDDDIKNAISRRLGIKRERINLK